MSDQQKPPGRRKRPRQKQTYTHHKNAVSVTVYDPQGSTIPVEVRQSIEDAVFQVAFPHKLLINIAYE